MGGETSQPIIEFRGVRLTGSGEKTGLDWTLKAGDLAYVNVPESGIRLPFTDTVHGIVPPEEGQVLFEEGDWASLDVRATERAKWNIGRVFDARMPKACWIQNLNILENVILGPCFRPGADKKEIVKRGEELAQQFGLPGIPISRPAQSTPYELAISQWIRAFLPDPLRLLILEFPGARVYDDASNSLFDAVEKAREEGTAVIWTGNASSASDLKRLSPDFSFVQTAQGKLILT